MSAPRRTAAECVALHLGWDVAEVREYAYRTGRTAAPVYAIGDAVYCCPPAGRKPPKDRDDGDMYAWRPVGAVEERTVYASGGES